MPQTETNRLGAQVFLAGMLSILENSNPKDADLLQAIWTGGYANLADRDHRLVFIASAAQLLAVRASA